MTRKSLCGEIELLNQRLNLHQVQFQQTSEQSKVALHQLNPYLLIGGGLLAGVMTSVVGWRKVYRYAGAGFSFFPLLVGG